MWHGPQSTYKPELALLKAVVKHPSHKTVNMTRLLLIILHNTWPQQYTDTLL